LKIERSKALLTPGVPIALLPLLRDLAGEVALLQAKRLAPVD
jgi:hypothetical protein